MSLLYQVVCMAIFRGHSLDSYLSTIACGCMKLRMVNHHCYFGRKETQKVVFIIYLIDEEDNV